METDMVRPITLAVSVLALALAHAAPVAAQEGTLKKIKDGGSITIGHRDASVPFSYYDDRQQPVGYAVDLCLRIVDAVKSELKLPRLDVRYQLVTSANRIPLMANGTIDLECGSTTNNLERQKQVGFTITHFVTANRWVAKKASNIKALPDLKGKTIVSTAGTTNIKQITEINAAQNLGMNIISANGHAEAFQKVVDNAMIQTYKSGAIDAIYGKWFLKPIPPRGLTLNVPMSDQFKKVIANPTDSGDPAAYK